MFAHRLSRLDCHSVLCSLSSTYISLKMSDHEDTSTHRIRGLPIRKKPDKPSFRLRKNAGGGGFPQAVVSDKGAFVSSSF